MALPLLQISLDTLTIEEGIKSVEKVRDQIDVIEVGTILIASKGTEAIKVISEKFPEKIIVADGKIADAGTVFGKMFFENGAQFTTAICAAEVPTMQGIMEIAKKFGKDKELQVELTSNYTWKQVEAWRAVGVPQAVYHRSRDSQAAGVGWTQNDIAVIRKLADAGFKVSVTGGITVEDIKFFKGLPVYIFIAGRSIRDADDPAQAAQEMKAEFAKYW